MPGGSFLQTAFASVLLAALFATLFPLSAALPPAQDDAGTGMDAPDAAEEAFPIAPNVAYEGTLFARGQGAGLTLLDDDDYYRIRIEAGQHIQLLFQTAPETCVWLRAPDDTVDTVGACVAGVLALNDAEAIAHVSGEWIVYMDYEYVGVPINALYRFAVSLDGAEVPFFEGVTINNGLAASRVAPVGPASPEGEHVVVAVIDTGVNPYHDFFAAPALMAHPSTWLDGFPETATTVPLSLDAPSIEAALEADDALWSSMRRSTWSPELRAHLYTFPGTRVIAGISFGEWSDTPLLSSEGRPVFDDHGHGTRSAGLALGANLPAAEGNVLLVMVEVGSFEDGLRWAAAQPWIDAISLSGGSRGNVGIPSILLGPDGSNEAITAAHASGKPVFVASGNGFSNTAIAPDRCQTGTSSYTGPIGSTLIGAASGHTGAPTWWHCIPVDAIARTGVRSPASDSLDKSSYATGTSASTPNVAGHWARLMLEARRESLPATRLDALDHLLHAAEWTHGEVAEYRVDPDLGPLSWIDQGYGLVDGGAMERALTTLREGEPTPRPEVDEWRALQHEIRRTLWGEALLEIP